MLLLLRLPHLIFDHPSPLEERNLAWLACRDLCAANVLTEKQVPALQSMLKNPRSWMCEWKVVARRGTTCWVLVRRRGQVDEMHIPRAKIDRARRLRSRRSMAMSALQ
tara:strand:- start:314 stop:637 length:324 start_codon:yes stop_codon:yes gene_type:complete